jgi:hypothetical protein
MEVCDKRTETFFVLNIVTDLLKALSYAARKPVAM